MVSQHPSKIGVHRHCGNRDKMVLVCLVVQQNHVTKDSRNFMDKNHQDKSPPAKSGGHKHCDSEDIMVLVFDVSCKIT